MSGRVHLRGFGVVGLVFTEVGCSPCQVRDDRVGEAVGLRLRAE